MLDISKGLNGLKDFKPIHYALGFSIIMATIAPGFLCLLMYKPALIQSLDVIKVIIASFSLTMPVTLINFVLIAGLDIFDKENIKDRMAKVWMAISLISSVILYGGLFFAYLSNMPFRYFVVTVVLLDAAVLVLTWIAKKMEKKKAAETKETQKPSAE